RSSDLYTPEAALANRAPSQTQRPKPRASPTTSISRRSGKIETELRHVVLLTALATIESQLLQAAWIPSRTWCVGFAPCPQHESSLNVPRCPFRVRPAASRRTLRQPRLRPARLRSFGAGRSVVAYTRPSRGWQPPRSRR